jgi:prevent-host-death family protein
VNVVPELVPIWALRTRQNQILRSLVKGPIVLTQHGQAAAVLVSLEQWDHLVETLEDLMDSPDAIEMKARVATGQESVID